MLANDLGKRIREIRHSLGITQQQLGEQLGVSGSTVSSYEIGDSLPSLEILVKLSRIGNASYDWLLAGCYMAKDDTGKIIQLTKDELEILKLYRKAAPQDRATIRRVAELATSTPTPSE